MSDAKEMKGADGKPLRREARKAVEYGHDAKPVRGVRGGLPYEKKAYVEWVKRDPLRWRAFKERREILKAKGMAIKLVYRALMAEFPMGDPKLSGLLEEVEPSGVGGSALKEKARLAARLGNDSRRAVERASEKAAWSEPPGSARVDAVSGGDRKCSELEAVAWVFETLETPGLKPADAPSGGAWGLRHWAKAHQGNLAHFYSTIFPRLLAARASRSGEDDESKFRDLGERAEEITEMFMRGLEQACPPEETVSAAGSGDTSD